MATIETDISNTRATVLYPKSSEEKKHAVDISNTNPIQIKY